jgi:hypothetical protein
VVQVGGPGVGGWLEQGIDEKGIVTDTCPTAYREGWLFNIFVETEKDSDETLVGWEAWFPEHSFESTRLVQVNEGEWVWADRRYGNCSTRRSGRSGAGRGSGDYGRARQRGDRLGRALAGSGRAGAYRSAEASETATCRLPSSSHDGEDSAGTLQVAAAHGAVGSRPSCATRCLRSGATRTRALPRR